MSNEKIKALAIDLMKANQEDQVVQILKNAGYWDSKDYWKPYGNENNNFSVINTQQANADNALVEKIINSVDAVLIKECYKCGINPKSKDAPQSIHGGTKTMVS